MKFERLNENNGKVSRVFLCGLITGVGLLIIFNLFLTKAKYKVVDSAKLVNSTINYSSADLNVIAMYKNDGEKDELIKEVPKGYYDIDNEKSYCIVGNNKEDKITNNMEYTGNSVKIDINKKGTKCYVYFIPEAANTLANLGIKEEIKEGKIEFTGIATESDSGLFSGEDDYGTTYYYRGIVNNNWVKIGEEYWRIIRINGNGTIRLIYNGKTTSQTGEETLAKTNVAFNETINDNKYVGFMYGTNSTSYEAAHKNEIKSNILTEIEKWYSTNDNLKKYIQYLDEATGFCGDRSKVTGEISEEEFTYTNLGYGTSSTIYGAYHRLLDNNDTTHWGNTQKPTFKCGIDPSNVDTLNKDYLERDLYTTKSEEGIGNGALQYPIGLITADEAIFAGNFIGKESYTNWLCNKQNYWTLSPRDLIGNNVVVFYIYVNGSLASGIVNNNRSIGLRPVINLKKDLEFKGNGTTSSPFEIIE